MKTNFLKTYHFVFIRQAFLSKVFLLGVIILGICYSILVVSTIHNISARKEVKTQISKTQVAISSLEEQYFALAGAIDTTTVQSMGFQESQDPIFAYVYDPYKNINGFAVAPQTNHLK